MLLFVLLFFGFCFGMDLNALDTKRQAFNSWKETTKPCPAEDCPSTRQGLDPFDNAQDRQDDRIVILFPDEDLDETFRNQAAKSIEQHLVRGEDARGGDK